MSVLHFCTIQETLTHVDGKLPQVRVQDTWATPSVKPDVVQTDKHTIEVWLGSQLNNLRTRAEKNVLVKPDMTFAMRPFKSLWVGDLFLSWVVQMSYKASFYPYQFCLHLKPVECDLHRYNK
jgi:hypothetical protein